MCDVFSRDDCLSAVLHCTLAALRPSDCACTCRRTSQVYWTLWSYNTSWCNKLTQKRRCWGADNRSLCQEKSLLPMESGGLAVCSWARRIHYTPTTPIYLKYADNRSLGQEKSLLPMESGGVSVCSWARRIHSTPTTPIYLKYVWAACYSPTCTKVF
jgi:hypothetical protein